MMTAPSAAPPRFLGVSAGTAAALLIATLTLFRLFYAVWLPMLPDETYYFQWSRHLDASYFSKGPAIAYTIWAGTHLFGPGALGVRFFAVLLSAGTAWQIFLLARRWFDETAALLAVLLAGVVPLYAIGSVLMTIDPLSAFFWIWAANLFSAAVQEERLTAWLLTGFAVGCGFLAKYLNALELVAFLLLLLLAPNRRRLLARPPFWSMIAVAVLTTLPVWWWNAAHHWVSAAQLSHRGHMQDRFSFHADTLLDFLGAQAAVISPLLFLVLLAGAILTARRLWREGVSPANEGSLLLLLLFLSVFLLYFILALHLRCEPNWPAVSYLSLIVLLAGSWRKIQVSRVSRFVLVAAFLVGWIETVALHDTRALPLGARQDPMSRTAGWPELAAEVETLRQQTGADEILADGYKEASVISFGLPGKPFVYALPHTPPATQFDFWPGLPLTPPHRVLWITDDTPPDAMAGKFATITPLGRLEVWFRHARQPLRVYRFYLCENLSQP